MARQEVNIGVEGNDGTGDSIRQSFRKVNENFVELYAVFGLGGRIEFTTLSDTPDVLTPHSIPLVNAAGDFISLVELATDDSGSIEFEFVDGVGDTPGQLVIKAGFSRVADDTTPKLSGGLYAGNHIIAGNYVPTSNDDPALELLNIINDTNLTVDNVVINKQYADLRYVTTESPIPIPNEPTGIGHYTWEIFDYISTPGPFYSSLYIIARRDPYTQETIVDGHGLDTSYNGKEIIFTAEFTIPNQLIDPTTVTPGNPNGNIYSPLYIRVISPQHIWLFTNKDDATNQDPDQATLTRLDISAASISDNDTHSITLADLDISLAGNFLANQAVPRKSLVLRDGDTMTGKLFLSDHPGDLAGSGTPNGEEDLQAATKLYVDQGAAHSSPEVLFVSTTGNDSMIGVPPGKEGTADAYAFRTIGAAAARADELVRTAEATLGPYLQTVTYTDNNEVKNSNVLDFFIDGGTENGGFNYSPRVLLEENRKYIQKETIAWINKTYPDFVYDLSYCERDLGLIIDAIRFDILRGLNANTLTKQAGERYYSSVSGRRAITSQLSQTVAALNFASNLSLDVLNQQLSNRVTILSISIGNPTIVTLSAQLDSSYQDGDLITFKGIPEIQDMSLLNGQNFYININNDSSTILYLYTDPELLIPYNTIGVVDTAYSNISDPAFFGKIYQTIEEQKFNDTLADVTQAQLSSVTSKWDIVETIISEGIDSINLPDINYGSIYKLVTSNANIGYLNQTADNNPDALPGKVLRGKQSKAIGRIVRFTNDDTNNAIDTELQPTTFDLHLLSAINFVPGEELEYANFIKKKEVVIRIEAGNYYEDYPIKVSNNVSIKGDEFRRVIIQPKTETNSNIPRISQSKWANTYFYRDSYFDGLTITTNGTSQFVNQLGENQGWFGYHYLQDPSKPINVDNGITITNPYGNNNAELILQRNKEFLQTEVIEYVNTAFPSLTYDQEKCKRDVGFIVDALGYDFKYGGESKTKEIQGSYHGSGYPETNNVLDDNPGQEAATISAMEKLRDLAYELLSGNIPTYTNTSEEPVILRNEINQQIQGEEGTADNIIKMVDKIKFVFDTANYNPPKRADEMDVFLLGDTTIIRNLTCRGHGGFMCVLDPDGQILTKSPYTQTASSFSKSINKQTFSGGMFVDAFVGNIPVVVQQDAENDAFKLSVTSNAGEGLYIRPPQLPCPFYLDGIRYQVNAISNYDQALGSAYIYLDRTSGPKVGNINTGFDISQIPVGGLNIFLQTAGNRSLLGNDYTQVNDLGYGLVVTNGAFSEMVSMFTYYCHVAYYSANGAEIRSLNGSNGYGNFGLVSEGADPNEIPDQVLLKETMTRPAQIYGGVGSVSGTTYNNNEGSSFVLITGMVEAPLPQSIITVDHGGTLNADGDAINVLHYRVASVSNITTLSGGDVSTNSTDTTIYRIELRADDVIVEDYFGLVQADLANQTYIDYTDNIQINLTNVANPGKLVTRPSTAINFDESDEITYRSLDFQTEDPYGNSLASDEIRVTLENNFDFIQLVPYQARTGQGYNQTGNTLAAIELLSSGGTYTDDVRIVDSTSPKVFSFKGRSHRITSYKPVYQFETSHILTPGNAGQGDTISNAGGTFTATVAFNSSSYDIEIIDPVGSFTIGETLYVNGTQISVVGGGSILFAGDVVPADPAWAIIEFADELDIIGAGTGLADNITAEYEFIFAGLAANSTAEITVAISLLRATGHDFTQIGTGGYNTSNYPNVILGDPLIPLTDTYWSNAPSGQTSAQVWEKRKGRVFWVSTDQYGFFRVGRFFSVDQGTGAITFSGEVGISNANALGFKKGVTIDEFSADEAMTDNSGSAVPTEKAVRSYIAQVLGVDPHNNTQFPGSGFLPLSGLNQPNPVEMKGDLGMGGFKIEDVGNPQSGTDGVNKNYVDKNVSNFDALSKLKDFMPAERNIDPAVSAPSPNSTPMPIGANEVFISTGLYIVYITTSDQTGTFDDGDEIRNAANPATATVFGDIIQSYSYTDAVYGTIRKILYSLQPEDTLNGLNLRPIDSNIDTAIYGGNYSSQTGLADDRGILLVDPVNLFPIGGSYGEITNAVNGLSTEGNDILVSTVRTTDSARVIFAIRENSIVNADVNSSAGILQSKLNLNAATTRADDTSISQADLGLSSFSSTEFNASSGWISIKDGGISVGKLADVGSNTVLGRTDANNGPVSAIPFSTITSSGGALIKSLFTNLGALVKTGADAWSTVAYTNLATANTLVQRDAEGSFQVKDLIYTGEVKFNQSGTVRKIFSSAGTGQIRVNDFAPTSVSIQSTAEADKGYVAAPQIYTKGIASNNTVVDPLDDANSTGANIYLGPSNSANSTTNSIIFWSKGQDRYRIDENNFVAFNAANLGSVANPFGTCYANVLSGYATKAKYADLAENYLADDEYFEGTVLVFGGAKEITVTNSKGDKRVAGVVSTNPAHLMNEALEGEHVTPLALQGRVPCKVIGKVAKGDMLVTSAIAGYAIVDNDPRIGTVLGKAVGEKTDDGKGVVEIVVGRL